MDENIKAEQSLDLDEEQLQAITGGAGDFLDQHVATHLKQANEHLETAQGINAKGQSGEKTYVDLAANQLNQANAMTASTSAAKAKWANFTNAMDKKWFGGK
jgi:hypothetical protein